MVEGTALEKRQVGNTGAWVQIPPSPLRGLPDIGKTANLLSLKCQKHRGEEADQEICFFSLLLFC